MTLEYEVAFDFDYTYTPGEPSTYDYPGSGPEVKITKVWLNGVEIPLKAVTDELYDQMVESVLEHYDNYDQADYSDY